MFNFGGITHIIPYPSGKYGYVGSVPLSCMDKRKPTTADIMGGRVQPDGFAYHNKAFTTADEAVTYARENGAKLCSAERCVCRKLF